jgi:hypothetical protein
MGSKGSKKRVPELAISGQSRADTADKKNEPQNVDHLKKIRVVLN